MANGVGGNLEGLLAPFQEQNPINLLAMIAQVGTQQPEVLAQLLAQAGAPVPTSTPAAGPTVGALAQQAQTIGPGALAGGGGVPTLAGAGPTPAQIPGGSAGDFAGVFPDLSGGGGGPLSTGGPIVAGAAPPSVAPAGPGGDKLEGLLTALSGLQTPAAPQVPNPPGAIAPRGGGPAPNPELLAQLFALLQGGAGAAQAGSIPSLGQLIAGKATPATTAQLTL